MAVGIDRGFRLQRGRLAGNTDPLGKQCRHVMAKTMPNFSATLILTRPQAASHAFASKLSADLPGNIRILVSPLLDIVPTGERPDLSVYAGVIFTSANAVRFAGSAQPCPTYCVGARTQEEAEAAGWQVDAQEQDSDHLFQALIRTNPPTPLVHVAGEHRRGAISARLTGAGIKTDEITVYRQDALPLTPDAVTALQGRAPVILPLFSPRTAAIFAAQHAGAAPLYIIAISAAALEPVCHLPSKRCDIAPSPDAEALRQQILETVRRVEAS
jgi:uroporphyrinogen-III synthase